MLERYQHPQAPEVQRKFPTFVILQAYLRAQRFVGWSNDAGTSPSQHRRTYIMVTSLSGSGFQRVPSNFQLLCTSVLFHLQCSHFAVGFCSS